MVDKKFSDFTPTNSLEDGELLASELVGVQNRRITFADFYSQIAKNLTRQATTELGVISFMMWENVGDAPVSLPKHKLWCNGATYYRNDNDGLVGSFIDYVYANASLRLQFKIPADKSYMIAPDLRNRHIVGAGSLNTYGTFLNSKSVDYINGISANSSTSVANKTGLYTAQKQGLYTYNAGAHTISINRGDGLSILDNDWYQGSNTFKKTKPLQFVPDHAHYVTDHDHYVQDHNHTATTTTSVNVAKNTALLDSVNRVPAFALFPVLDINVNGLTLDPEAGGNPVINIDDVIGLTNALNLKLDASIYNAFVGNVYLKTDVYNKAETYAKSQVDTLIAGKMDDVKTLFHRQFTGTTGSVGGNSIVRALDSMVLTSGLGFDSTTLTFTTGTNAKITELLDGVRNYKELRFAIRIIKAGAGNTQLEIGLHRVADGVQIRSDTIQLTDPDSLNGNALILSYCNGSTDPFAIGGYYFTIRNLTNITLSWSSITIDIYASIGRQ